MEIIDKRKIKFFLIDNKILDVIRNPYSISVYCCLVCYSFGKGYSYPSLNTIAYKCGISQSSTIKAIKHLQGLGLIDIARENSRSGNKYFINDVSEYEELPPGPGVTLPLKVEASDESRIAPDHARHSMRGEPGGGAGLTSPPPGPDLPIPTWVNKKIKKRSPVPFAQPPAGRGYVIEKPQEVSDELWEEFVAHRKMKRSALSPMVVERFRSEAAQAGISLAEAMQESIFRGWQGFKAEWYRGTPKTPPRKTEAVDHL